MIVVGGGSGRRFGSLKQFEDLGGRQVIDLAVECVAAVADGVVAVVPAGCEHLVAPAPRLVAVVAGGATRSESVRHGLAAVPAGARIIGVHDAARPFAPVSMIEAAVDAVRDGAAGVIPAVPVTDTIKVVDEEGNVVSTPDRASLVAVQTPQVFDAAVLRRAHAAGAEGTDDASLLEMLGERVLVVSGDADNRKITRPEDLDWARGLVAARSGVPSERAEQLRSGIVSNRGAKGQVD